MSRAQEVLERIEKIHEFLFQKHELKDKRSFMRSVLDNLKEQYDPNNKNLDWKEIFTEEDSLKHYKDVYKKVIRSVSKAIKKLDDSVFPIKESDFNTLWLETTDLFDLTDDDFSEAFERLINDFVVSLDNL